MCKFLFVRVIPSDRDEALSEVEGEAEGERNPLSAYFRKRTPLDLQVVRDSSPHTGVRNDIKVIEAGNFHTGLN